MPITDSQKKSFRSSTRFKNLSNKKTPALQARYPSVTRYIFKLFGACTFHVLRVFKDTGVGVGAFPHTSTKCPWQDWHNVSRQKVITQWHNLLQGRNVDAGSDATIPPLHCAEQYLDCWLTPLSKFTHYCICTVNSGAHASQDGVLCRSRLEASPVLSMRHTLQSKQRRYFVKWHRRNESATGKSHYT